MRFWLRHYVGTGVAVDGNGYFYLIGETTAGKLPTTANVIQPSGAPLDSGGVYVVASAWLLPYLDYHQRGYVPSNINSSPPSPLLFPIQN